MLVNKEQLYWTWNNGLVQHWKKGVHQIYILLPCLFNFYAENILNNAELDEVKLESSLPGEISVTSDMQVTPP